MHVCPPLLMPARAQPAQIDMNWWHFCTSNASAHRLELIPHAITACAHTFYKCAGRRRLSCVCYDGLRHRDPGQEVVQQGNVAGEGHFKLYLLRGSIWYDDKYLTIRTCCMADPHLHSRCAASCSQNNWCITLRKGFEKRVCKQRPSALRFENQTPLSNTFVLLLSCCIDTIIIR